MTKANFNYKIKKANNKKSKIIRIMIKVSNCNINIIGKHVFKIFIFDF